jgi:hypothetical protein
MLHANTRSWLRSRGVVLALCGLAIVLIGLGAAAVSATGETKLVLTPVGEAYAGELITVRLVARNARNAAGFQGTVEYDAAGLRLAGANVEDGLGRWGRGLMPLGPVLREGSVVLGAATCPAACADASAAARAQVAGGASGTVELGTLEFFSPAAGSYTLNLTGVQLVDPDGNRLEVQAEPLVLEVRTRDGG